MEHSSSPHDTEYSLQPDNSDSTGMTMVDTEAYDEFMASLDPLLNHLYREGFSEQVIHLDELRTQMEDTRSEGSDTNDRS